MSPYCFVGAAETAAPPEVCFIALLVQQGLLHPLILVDNFKS